jgi:hypothetical protein
VVEEEIAVEMAPTAEPTQVPTEKPQATYTDQPTYTPLPTYTALPTYTPLPTSTDLPTATRQPTNTPRPTATASSIPPTELPAATAVPQPTELPPPAVVGIGKLIIVGVDKRAEFVDIQNAGDGAIDLGGWKLVSEKGNQVCFLGGQIAPGVVLRIWALAEDAGQGGFNCQFDSNIWNNSEPDAAVLYDASGNEVARQ